MQKRIVIYGENWIGTLPRLLSDELKRHGHQVVHFDFTDILPGIKDRSFLPRIKRRAFSRFYAMEIQEKFCKVVRDKRPDYIIIAKGLHLNQASLRRIKDCGAILVNWNPDDFFNLKNSNESLISSIPLYDLIISSREHLFSKYREHGARHLLYLDWYYVQELHFDRGLSKTIPASFVGSWSPSREDFIGRLNMPFKIWGGGWEKSSREFRKRHDVQPKILSQPEMSAVFNSSHYNLNLLTHENSDHSNLRFFEVPASGGLLLTERSECASRYLSDGKECLMFSSADEVNRLLSDKQELDLDAIARAGRLRIINGMNSFTDRVDELLSYLLCTH